MGTLTAGKNKTHVLPSNSASEVIEMRNFNSPQVSQPKETTPAGLPARETAPGQTASVLKKIHRLEHSDV